MFKSAFITGASGGIGRGLAIRYARSGTRVFAAARRLDQLQALAEEVAGDGVVVPVQLDVTDAGTTRDTIMRIDDECGGLDLVIANAAVSPETPGDEECWERVAQTIDTNVTGAAATLSAVAPRMAERGRGTLAGLSSLGATRGLPRSGAYSASKAFLSTYLEGLRVDLGEHGVKVTTIQCGWVKTPSTDAYDFPMPFILELDDAVARIGRAIDKGVAVSAFPWPLVNAARAMRLLPNAVYDRAARRAGPERG